MWTYFVRVYVPNRECSYSNYERKSEKNLQLMMWASLILGSVVFSYHIVNLFTCNANPRQLVCSTLLYQWGLYGGLLGLAGFLAMLLHYGYMDPLQSADDVDSILDDIRSRAGSDLNTELEEVSVIDEDELY